MIMFNNLSYILKSITRIGYIDVKYLTIVHRTYYLDDQLIE